MRFETREDPTSIHKLFRKEKFKVSQQEEGKRAQRQGILFRRGEKPDAGEDRELSGILAGKVVQFVSRTEDNVNTSTWYKLGKIKRYWEANQCDNESQVLMLLDYIALMGEAIILTYANIRSEDLIENEAKIGSACYFVQLSSFSSKLNLAFILIHPLITGELGGADSRGCEGDDFHQRRQARERKTTPTHAHAPTTGL